MNLLWYLLGLTDPAAPPYLFWSGICGNLSLLGAAATLYTKHNCHIKRCWRIGRLTHNQHLVCRKHHPNDAPTKHDMTQQNGPPPAK